MSFDDFYRLFDVKSLFHLLKTHKDNVNKAYFQEISQLFTPGHCMSLQKCLFSITDYKYRKKCHTIWIEKKSMYSLWFSFNASNTIQK